MKNTKDPGLGSQFLKPVHRMMNKDGSYNIIRKGGLNGLKDFYKYLIDVHWIVFFLILIGSFILLNLVFATIYILIGIEQINGLNPDIPEFISAFFFSAQTFTTVGYGALHPNGVLTNFFATFESFLGLLSFAISTGLLWGRFSKPSVKIAFSRNIIITPFEEGMAVMFKMVNERQNVLLNTKVKCIFIIDKGVGQLAFNKDYYNLKLETDQVNFFPLTWTLVHKINADSPLFGLEICDLIKRNAEVIILVETFDETFSLTIHHKHSYGGDQWLENVQFERNFEANGKGQIELNVKDINRYTSVK
jgi:inward rectifier potassium channel